MPQRAGPGFQRVGKSRHVKSGNIQDPKGWENPGPQIAGKCRDPEGREIRQSCWIWRTWGILPDLAGPVPLVDLTELRKLVELAYLVGQSDLVNLPVLADLLDLVELTEPMDLAQGTWQ